MKKLLQIPEFYFAASALILTYKAPVGMQVLCLTIALLFLAQAYFKPRFVGQALGVILFLLNLIFLAALSSEFLEFPNPAEGLSLIGFGLFLWILNMLMTALLFYKYRGRSVA